MEEEQNTAQWGIEKYSASAAQALQKRTRQDIGTRNQQIAIETLTDPSANSGAYFFSQADY